MPKSDLTGKTVMIAGGMPNESLFSSLKSSLEKQGATVVLSQHSAMNPDNVPLISDEITRHEPKIDALIIHDPDTIGRDSILAAIALKRKLKDTLPVIIHDWPGNILITQPKEAGAKYVNFEGPEDKIAFAVADAIAQHGKPGKQVGG